MWRSAALRRQATAGAGQGQRAERDGAAMTERRRFSQAERRALYLSTDGCCEICGTDLQPSWHSDHKTAWSQGGATDVLNGQPTCPRCNLMKGARSVPQPLLPWQQDAKRLYETTVSEQQARFLIASFPGTGKTVAAAAIAASTGRFVIVVAPQTDVLKSWRRTLHDWGLCTAAVRGGDQGAIGSTCPGCGKVARAVVLSYQFVAANPHILASLLRKHRPTLLILDEVHHLREDGAWLIPFRAAWPYVEKVLCLSGTPFRSNEEPVPFIHTTGPHFRELDLLPDSCVFEYAYRRAISDKPVVVARAVFQRYDADVEWLEGPADDRVLRSVRLSDEHSKETARKARRYALNPQGDWLGRVMRDSDTQLDALRTHDPRGGGLVICRDTDHAVRVADVYASGQQEPVFVYTADYQTSRHQWGNGRKDEDSGLRWGHDPSADVLDAYREGSAKWIITVRKISEGVDIPRLRVLVYATTASTFLFFCQAFGRVIRLRRDLPATADQHAWIYIPEAQPIDGYAKDIEDSIADATLAEIEEDEEEESRRDQNRERSDPQDWDEFISARADYVGATFGGQHLNPELMRLASTLSGSPEDKLPVLVELHSRGLLNLAGTPTAEPPRAAAAAFDPMRDLEAAKAKKDRAVKSWAALRLRRGEFADYREAAQACNSEVGNEFNVWQSNINVTAEQLRKATQWIGEQIRGLRRA